ncbi:hypothetical protein JYU34_022068, partial [Plutella xylostella]
MPTIDIEDIVTPQSATLEPASEPPPPATECTSPSVTGETQSASGTPPETHSVVADSNLRSDDDEEFQEAIDSESEPDTAVEGRRVGVNQKSQQNNPCHRHTKTPSSKYQNRPQPGDESICPNPL